jgi:hypothetical protein
MLSLADRESTIRFYSQLADSRGASASIQQSTKQLLPYLCRALLLGKPLPEPTVEILMTGSANASLNLAPLDSTASITICTGGFSAQLLTALPLAGHQLMVPSVDDMHYIEMALKFLAESHCARTIKAFTSMIVWLQLDELAPPEVPLTSVAIPLFPHCTFLTRKALCHIPPVHVFDQPWEYALAENIYHESLHQQLTATMLQEDIFPPDYNAEMSLPIFIPWRQQFWPVDRVLHAAHVYQGIIPLRSKHLTNSFLTKEQFGFLDSAVRSAESCLKHLKNCLFQNQQAFTADGWSYVAEHLM